MNNWTTIRSDRHSCERAFTVHHMHDQPLLHMHVTVGVCSMDAGVFTPKQARELAAALIYHASKAEAVAAALIEAAA